MPTQLLATSIWFLILTVSAGCAGRQSASTAVPATQSTSDWRAEWRDTHYQFDATRCSLEEQRAIRAATKAVIGTDEPSPEQAVRLRFSIRESADGWSLTVWDFGPDEVPVPGGFTAVMLNRDFTVRRVGGGA